MILTPTTFLPGAANRSTAAGCSHPDPNHRDMRQSSSCLHHHQRHSSSFEMSNLPWSLSLALWFGVGCWGCGRQSVDPRQASNHAQHTSALSPGQSQHRTPEAGRLFHTSGGASSFNPRPMSRCSTSRLQEALFSHAANRCKPLGPAQSRGLAPLALPVSGGPSVPGRQCSMQWRAEVVSAASSHSPNFPIHVVLPIVFILEFSFSFFLTAHCQSFDHGKTIPFSFPWPSSFPLSF